MKKMILSDKTEFVYRSSEGLWNIQIPLTEEGQLKSLVGKLTLDNMRTVIMEEDGHTVATYEDVTLVQPISLYTDGNVTAILNLRVRTKEEKQQDTIRMLEKTVTQLQEALVEMYEKEVISAAESLLP